MLPVAGFVLAGGQSSRMGQDKALLPVEGRALILKIAGEIAAVAGSAVIIGAKERYADLGLPVIEDLNPGLGPLAGIETALATGQAAWNLIVACDMPAISRKGLKKLIETAQAQGGDCVIGVTAEGKLNALYGVYSVTALPTIQRAVAARQLKVRDALQQLQVIHVPVDNEDEVLNLNTPEEYQRFLRRG